MKSVSSRGVLAAVLLTIVAGTTAGFADSGLARHKKLYVVPAPGKVTIDGKLDDWDLSGQIETYVESETADTQSGKFALMYDSKNLYLSGVVRDNSPMLNRNDPQAEGDRGWNADSCQFRIALDPKLPYPLDIGYGNGDMKNMDVTHVTLWYYSDKQQPEMQIQKSMELKSARPAWEPYGVVPNNLFQAKYLKMADGLGYTFEYAIPWTTLDAKAPLKANDMVAGTMQFNFSDDTGLKTDGGWIYDVMSRPSFPYQNTLCWGKFLFTAKGHIDRSLVEEGLPPTRELPLKYKYMLPKDSQVTLQIEDNQRIVRRILVAQGDRGAGANSELWDGLDSDGNPLPAGQYTVRGLYHTPVTQKVLFSPNDSGQPVYKTNDGTGAWGGDEGNPRSIVATDSGILMAWAGAEAGSGIIRTDFDGHKKWGNLHCASFMASDGKRLFTAGDMGFDRSPGVVVLDAAEGRQLAFGQGQSNLLPPAGGTEDTNTVTGLAYRAGTVYVSYAARNFIAAYDGDSGASKGNISLDKPGQLAAAADSLLTVQGGAVVKVVDGAVKPFVTGHLDDPRGITVGADGSIYVANGGALQNVSVFDGQGNYLRSIGKPGGRPAVGHYDSSGMLEPDGIAIDKNGHLWVAEMLDAPKRISEWDAATGALVNEFFGGCSYFGYSYINPRHPDEIYCQNSLWKIDWQNNTCAPVSTIWRATTPDTMFPPGEDGYESHPIFMTAKNGHDYEYGGLTGFDWILSRRDGDVYKPVAATIRVSPFGGGAPFKFMTPDKYPNGDYFWQDANDDQIVQADEITPITDGPFTGLDGDLNLYMSDKKFAPVSVQANGRPIYDITKPIKTIGYSNEDDGSVYGRAERLSADGKIMWQFPNILEWGNALSKPVQAPGRLWGLTNYLGVAGDLTGWSDYFTTYHVFTRDGVYVGMLMRDTRAGGSGLGPDVTGSETATGQLVQPDGMNGRTFLLAGAGDARVTEIFGLNDIKRISDSVLTLTDADVQAANKALTDYNSQLAHSKHLSIARGLDGLGTAEAITRQSEGGRSFTVRAAYDADNMYIAYDVTSPNKLVNSEEAPQLIFKGGNVLDIQIAADQNADPKRATPAPGDTRILVTRQNDKPFVMLYQPKLKGFTGAPIVLSSPTGKEAFDSIAATDKVGLKYTPSADGYSAVITIPRALIGLQLAPGMKLKMDVGVIYGNETGNTETSRSYWANNSFNANVTYDVPDESRLEPAQWGTATVE